MPRAKTSSRGDRGATTGASTEPPDPSPARAEALPGHQDILDEDPGEDPGVDGIDDLSFREARAALDLTLAELQGNALDVEAMADLYRRALRYVERCEEVLQQVEQEVMQWDPVDPGASPKTFEP